MVPEVKHGYRERRKSGKKNGRSHYSPRVVHEDLLETYLNQSSGFGGWVGEILQDRRDDYRCKSLGNRHLGLQRRT